MSNARNLAGVISGAYDIPASSLGNVPKLDGSSPANAAPSAKYLKDVLNITTSGFFYIKLRGWTTAQLIYCDMERDGGGWMLWGQRTSSSSQIDIRYTGHFSGWASSSSHITGDWGDLTQEGHVNMWPFFDGSKEIRWFNNVSGVTSNSPGTPNTTVLIVKEAFNRPLGSNKDFWSFGGASCPSSSLRYTYERLYADSGWYNSHTSGANACSGWGHNSDYQNVSNFVGNSDCGACYYPNAVLFGNGTSGYYNHGNSYDNDSLSFALVSGFSDVSIPNHYSISNQIWVR